MLKIVSRDQNIVTVQAHCDNCDSGWFEQQLFLSFGNRPWMAIYKHTVPLFYPGPPDLCLSCVNNRLGDRVYEALREFEEGVNTE